MKRKILFAGIDGSGKSTSLEMLVSKLQGNYRILKISYNTGFIHYRNELIDVFQSKMATRLETLRPLFKRWHCYGLFLIFNFFYKRARMFYLELRQPCDFVLYDTDTLVRPAVHMTLHVPFLRLVSQRVRLRVTSPLFGRTRNSVIFFLDAEPATAMDRIAKRAKPIEAHETLETLAVLRGEFHKVVQAAEQIGLSVVTVSTDQKSPEEVSLEMARALARLCHITTDEIGGTVNGCHVDTLS
jgi:thymidylate kinase